MPFIPTSETSIFYRVWDVKSPTANVVLFHGLGEHSGLYHRFAYDMNAQGFQVWAIDHTAHGHTPGNLEEVYDVFGLADHAIELIRFVQEQEEDLPLVVIGHSLGGVTASTVLSKENAPAIHGLVLTGTPLEPVTGLADLDSVVMSRDKMYLDELSVDPLVPREEVDLIKLNKGLSATQEIISSKISTWKFPVLFVNGETDPIASPANAKKWAERLLFGQVIEIRGGCHDIINDSCHATVSQLISSFVYEVTSKEVSVL